MSREVAQATPILYFRRFRMEYQVGPTWRPPRLPDPYEWVPWRDDLVDLFAEVNYLCFRGELDAEVFPCLGEREGCRRLMREIRLKPGFLAAATWLVAAPEGCVGTIQGIIEPGRLGSIQNVGVMPGYRGRGLGGLLVQQAIDGFARASIRNVHLEVTAENEPAVRLYRKLGFQRIKTSYRAVPQATS